MGRGRGEKPGGHPLRRRVAASGYRSALWRLLSSVGLSKTSSAFGGRIESLLGVTLRIHGSSGSGWDPFWGRSKYGARPDTTTSKLNIRGPRRSPKIPEGPGGRPRVLRNSRRQRTSKNTRTHNPQYFCSLLRSSMAGGGTKKRSLRGRWPPSKRSSRRAEGPSGDRSRLDRRIALGAI